jgi:hypothetical protein
MHGLDGTDVLQLFERGFASGVTERGLLLLERAWPEAEPDLRAALPLGERDRLLMALRASTFGAEAPVRATCPECGSELEAGFDLRTLLETAADSFADRSFRHGDREYRFRPPGSADLLAVVSEGESDGVQLLARCVENCDPDQSADRELRKAFVAAVAEADPLVEVELELECGDCGHSWSEIFDIVDYFWSEVEVHARRLFQEIHTLASAYGWSEKEILSLSAARRRIYLGMATA